MPESISGCHEDAKFETYVEKECECPSCGAKGAKVFYQAEAIPVHSCLLLEDRQNAVRYPRRDLRLGFCLACGFIYNTVFDPSILEYCSGYEDMQTFSGHFRAYLKSLAQRMVKQYDLYEKDILEIGCGKGDFLLLLCKLGGNRGIGLDPSFDPDRLLEPPGVGVRFIRDFYSAKYAHLPADFICCRHTLEHICAPGEFMRTLRKAVGTRQNTIVFFDLPNILRILREGAFWDIYYEHCSYFSPGSLARLFRLSGFELVQVALDYGDQYALIVARPSSSTSGRRTEFDLEADLDNLHVGVEDFAESCPKHIEAWRKALGRRLADGQTVAIWGSGSKCVAFLTTIGLEDEIRLVVDINPYRHGKYIPGTGHRISAPSALTENPPDLVIVMNPVYRAEIQDEIDRMGIHPKLETVLTL